MHRESVNKLVLVLLAIFISAIFLSMIRPFLMAIFLAGIFSALARPLYRRLERWLGGRRAIASVVTLILLIMLILVPLSGLLGIITAQAIHVAESVAPWIKQQLSGQGRLFDTLRDLPLYEHIAPYKDTILEKAGQMVASISKFLIQNLSAATMGTVQFLFMFFVLLYTMFFFLMDGEKLIQKVLYYLPLDSEDKGRLLDKFASVTRATLKGTVVIAVLQGGLAGFAFVVVGIPSAVFWGTIMVVLSIIPGIGSALVWAPAALILIASGHLVKGIGLAIFCAVVVGSIDNFLRPVLVGRDTRMHELMIFFGTLGGILMFGMLGFIIGPIVAALFLTVWEIYGVVFRDMLHEPEVPSAEDSSKSAD